MLKRVVGGSPQKIPESYQSRSPIYMVDKIHCPVLVMHGTQDTQVDFSHGLNLYHQLIDIGVPTTFHRYDNYDHHFPLPTHLVATERMFQWISQ
ncbi:Prolyl oligopeptidase family protein [compost metagenome]